jgi:hypothetical protein
MENQKRNNKGDSKYVSPLGIMPFDLILSAHEPMI